MKGQKIFTKKMIWMLSLLGILILGVTVFGILKNNSKNYNSQSSEEAVVSESLIAEADSEEAIPSDNERPSEKTKPADAGKENTADQDKIELPEDNNTNPKDNKGKDSKVVLPQGTVPENTSKPALTPEGNEIPEEEIPVVLAEHEQEEVIVSFAEGYDAIALTNAINASGCTVPYTITDEDMMFGFTKLTVSPEYDVEHAMVQLELLPEIEIAQPNFIYYQADFDSEQEESESKQESEEVGQEDVTPVKASPQAISTNDPDLKVQWMLDSINAYEAWDVVKTEGSVTVAVLDNGFSLDHEDLDDNYLRDESGQIVMYYAQDDTTEYEVEGAHGTHVAGIVAAEANNGKGVAGVSYNAKILPVNVFNPLGGASTYHIIKGMHYVLTYSKSHPEANIHVINMSLGSPCSGQDYRENYQYGSLDRVFFNLVDDCTENNILTVMASGNDADSYDGGGYLNWAGDMADNILNVICLEKGTDGAEPKRIFWSNYNRGGEYSKNISAPGADIYSTSYSFKSYSYGYENMSGTSMASPCVAGVAALVYAANPNLTAVEARDIILNTANRIHKDEGIYQNGFSAEYGYGEVDAYAAVSLAKNMYELSLAGDSEMLKGDSVTLVPVDKDHVEVEGNFEWSSSNEDIAVVSDDGVVTGVSGGKVTITASIGDTEISKNITVYEVTFTGETTTEFAKGLKMKFDVTPADSYWSLVVADDNFEKAGETTYEESLGDAFEFDVFSYYVGTVYLTAILEKNPKLKVNFPLEITPSDISLLDVTVENAAYTGDEVTPDIEARLDRMLVSKPSEKFDSLTFNPDKDFTVTFENNVEVADKDSEEPPVAVLTGKDVLKGTVRIPFSITGEVIHPEDITLEKDEFEFTGKDITPNVTVVHNGVTLKENTDYKVEYIDNVYANRSETETPIVRVTGIGGYAGTTEISFTILPVDINNVTVAKINNVFYTGRPQKPIISATFNGIDLGDAKDFEVSYENNIEVGEATAILEGVGNYTGIRQETFKICNKNIDYEDFDFRLPEGKNMIYDGTPKELEISIIYTGKYVEGSEFDQLIENEDYTVSYEDNINAGIGKVMVDFIGDYAYLGGRFENGFYIHQANIFDTDIEVPGSFVYTGEEIEPKPVIKYHDMLLTEGVDYTLSYDNNVEIADADSDNPPSVTIRGIGNYKEEYTVFFSITGHTHIWSISSEGATITAVCGNEDGAHEGDLSQSITIIAPEYDTEGGEGSPEATLEGSIDGFELPEIEYYDEDGILSDGAPTTAGTFFARITIEDVTAEVEYTIGEKEEEDPVDPEDPEEPEEEVVTVPTDWLDPLRGELAIAAEVAKTTGQPQTVICSGDYALPYEFMQLLKDNPLITLKYSLFYEGTEYTVIISGSGVYANPSVEWYGPVFLIDYYCKNMKAGSGMYIVQRGDTLSKIAKRFGSTVPMLASGNGIKNPDYILPGQVIVY